MKYEDLDPEQVARIKRIIKDHDKWADVSDICTSSMLKCIALVAFNRNAPKCFIDERWHEVVKIYDVAKAEMRDGT